MKCFMEECENLLFGIIEIRMLILLVKLFQKVFFLSDKMKACANELFHADQFDVQADYYWPLVGTFGANWQHVRRLAPNGNLVGWMRMKNDNGYVCSDTLLGNAVARDETELAAFDNNNKKVTMYTTGQYTRYFEWWAVTDYLIVTGDHSLWVKFTRTALENAISSSSAGPFPMCVTLQASTSINTVVHAVNILFRSSKSDIFIGAHDQTCPNPYVFF